ncbi:regenerating islet-derived protein 4-like [Protopterus annectens]|uniref:regenerating islet-derived protein 4-like n=1 Tax=Protopterus annectens TaxID=7888 RepID=UPI001CF98FF4|nr:regenerating islet-derived protein 4-like [Protopterus annectens]
MSSSLVIALIIIFVSLNEANASSAQARSSCPPGWFYYKSNCYGYFRHKLIWSDAEVDCQAYGHGAHLASIQNDLETSIISSHIKAYQRTTNVWIGLHDPEQNNRWKWTDGAIFNYRAWSSGKPDNYCGKEFCGELLSSQSLCVSPGCGPAARPMGIAV